MNRLVVKILIALAPVLGTCIAADDASARGAEGRRPNVLFLLTDDQRPSCSETQPYRLP